MQAEIRFAAEEDAARMLEIYMPYVLETPITFETVPPGPEEFRARVRAGGEDFPWLVCAIDGKIMGYAYASRFHGRAAFGWDAELSIYVDCSATHRGIGRALYTALIALLARLGYYNLYAVVTVPNKKSAGLHRFFGFSEEGTLHNAGYKLGKWHDVAYLVKRLRPYDAPKPPKKLTDLDPQATAALFLTGQQLVAPGE